MIEQTSVSRTISWFCLDVPTGLIKVKEIYSVSKYISQFVFKEGGTPRTCSKEVVPKENPAHCLLEGFHPSLFLES